PPPQPSLFPYTTLFRSSIRTASACVPRRTPSYTPTAIATSSSWRWSGAAGTFPPTLPTTDHEPPTLSESSDDGSEFADLPAATTTSVPVAGTRRGTVHRTTTATTANTAAPIHRERARLVRA